MHWQLFFSLSYRSVESVELVDKTSIKNQNEGLKHKVHVHATSTNSLLQAVDNPFLNMEHQNNLEVNGAPSTSVR